MVWINVFVLDLDLVLQCLFFRLQIWKGSTDSKMTKRISKEETEKRLLDSYLEVDDLNKETEEVQDPEKTVKTV